MNSQPQLSIVEAELPPHYAGREGTAAIVWIMPVATHKLAVVVPTIGRYDNLRRMLRSLAAQTRLPEEVLVVGEGEGNAQVAREFPEPHARFINLPGSSICDARNRGMQAVRPDADLIAFMDDDIVFEPGAMEAMLRFWDTASEDVGGAAFNLINYPSLTASRLKNSRMAFRLGLYSPVPGAVARSGFQTLLGCIPETAFVGWLPTWAVVYRRSVFESYSFDEWFETYSYLEDLELSYRIGKSHKLAVVADARFYHFPSQVGRVNQFAMGRKEVLNRLYFVRKNPELSLASCLMALGIRNAVSLLSGLAARDVGHLKRALGNGAGLLAVAKEGLRSAHTRRKENGQ